MSMWRRHSGDSTWHQGREAIHSFVTFCHGRWPLADELDGQVEHSENPPHNERCEPCERQRLEEVRIEQGLRELRASDADELPPARVVSWPSTWPDFDLTDVDGGES